MAVVNALLPSQICPFGLNGSTHYLLLNFSQVIPPVSSFVLPSGFRAALLTYAWLCGLPPCSGVGGKLLVHAGLALNRALWHPASCQICWNMAYSPAHSRGWERVGGGGGWGPDFRVRCSQAEEGSVRSSRSSWVQHWLSLTGKLPTQVLRWPTPHVGLRDEEEPRAP